MVGSKHWSCRGDQFHSLSTCLSCKEMLDWLGNSFPCRLESNLQVSPYKSTSIFLIGRKWAVSWGQLPKLTFEHICTHKWQSRYNSYWIYSVQNDTLFRKKICFSAVKLVCWNSAKWKPYHSKYINFNYSFLFAWRNSLMWHTYVHTFPCCSNMN